METARGSVGVHYPSRITVASDDKLLVYDLTTPGAEPQLWWRGKRCRTAAERARMNPPRSPDGFAVRTVGLDECAGISSDQSTGPNLRHAE